MQNSMRKHVPSNYHHHNNNHENPKDETASNSNAMNLDMKDHIMDENIHFQVRQSQQSKARQDYQQQKMATKIKNPTYINQQIQSQPVYPILARMPLICNTVQQSVPLASTIQLRVSHPNNRRQVATLQPRATHTPDRRHETVKDRRYAGHHVHKHNNTRHNNQGIHDSHNSTRQTTTSYNQEPRDKTRTHKEDLLCQPSYQKSRSKQKQQQKKLYHF